MVTDRSLVALGAGQTVRLRRADVLARLRRGVGTTSTRDAGAAGGEKELRRRLDRVRRRRANNRFSGPEEKLRLSSPGSGCVEQKIEESFPSASGSVSQKMKAAPGAIATQRQVDRKKVRTDDGPR